MLLVGGGIQNCYHDSVRGRKRLRRHVKLPLPQCSSCDGDADGPGPSRCRARCMGQRLCSPGWLPGNGGGGGSAF